MFEQLLEIFRAFNFRSQVTVVYLSYSSDCVSNSISKSYQNQSKHLLMQCSDQERNQVGFDYKIRAQLSVKKQKHFRLEKCRNLIIESETNTNKPKERD